MPYGSVKLIPGLNVEKTPTLNEAGYSATQLVRFRDGLVQKMGGYSRFYPNAVAGTPRDLHAWEDLNATSHLAVGTTTQLDVITSGSLQDITPQTLTSDFAPLITATAGSPTIAITDPNISNVTTYDSVLFNTPVSVGGLILSGLYPIATITGTHAYNITAASNAANNSTLATNNTTAAGNATLHFASSVPAWVVAGMLIVDATTGSAIPANTTVVSTTTTTVVMSNNAAGAGVGNGDTIAFVGIPVFTTQSNNSVVSVALAAHGLVAAQLHAIVFQIPTTGNGVTITGGYTITSVTDANNFSITATTSASSSGSFTMNSGLAELLYYINLGPPPTGAGYGLGAYGAGGYGLGTSTSSQTGTEITATDWTQDNWGEILLSNPASGGIYQFDPTGGFTNAGLISTAPIFNGGIFVSTSLQILFAWASTQAAQIGVGQDPMLVRWSDQGDYTNFTASATNQAGSFRIPIGSTLRVGGAFQNQNLFWTDLDLWAANYAGFPLVFGFNKIGAGAGAISSHAVQQLRGGVYWMGPTNFYAYDGHGLRVIPCPVWDAVFQNLNSSTTNQAKIRAMPNTPFNEVGWLFPSAASTGENDMYVKFNITEPGNPWDIGPAGTMPRSAWIDQTVLGMPLAASPAGIIYRQESTNDADGQPLNWSFTTGYFYIGDGEDFAFVDQVIPDFIWGTYAGAQTAQVSITLNGINYPGDTPTVYGPYVVTQSSQWFNPRVRNRQMSITCSGSDIGSFARLGKVRYRWSPAGRR